MEWMYRTISKAIFTRFIHDNGWMEIEYKGSMITYITPAGNVVTTNHTEETVAVIPASKTGKS